MKNQKQYFSQDSRSWVTKQSKPEVTKSTALKTEKNFPILKNKDNIDILTGQVWEQPCSKPQIKLIAQDGSLFWAKLYLKDGLEINKTIKYDNPRLHRLISCPVLGDDMDDYDIVTDEHKEQYTIHSECEAWDNFYNEWTGHYPADWEDDVLYRVPRGFDWESYKKEKTNRQRLIDAGVPEHQLAKVPKEAIVDLDDPVDPEMPNSRILEYSFGWDEVSQGFKYWNHVCNILHNNGKYTEEDEKEYWTKEEQPKPDIESITINHKPTDWSSVEPIELIETMCRQLTNIAYDLQHISEAVNEMRGEV